MIKYIDNIYVLHVKNGYEDREKSISSQMEKMNLPFTWILEHDIPELQQEDIKAYFTDEHPLRNSELSCSMKHIQTLKEIINNKDEIALVLEDDVIFSKDTLQILTAITPEVQRLEKDFVISLGNSNNWYTPKKDLLQDKHLYKNIKNKTADSFLISKLAAKKRLDWIEENRTDLPADGMYDYIDKVVQNNIYWLEPTVAMQGSQTGLFQSSIQPEKPFRKFRWIFRDIKKKYFS